MRSRGSRMHLCGMWLLIQMSFPRSRGIYYVDRWMTRCGTGRAFKGNFIAAVMFQVSLQRRTFSHEWLNKKDNNSQHSPGSWQSTKRLTHGILTTAHEASTNPQSAKAQRGKTTCLLDAQQVRKRVGISALVSYSRAWVLHTQPPFSL